MILSIVIPAYNEEEAIENICRQTLNARESIIRETPVDEVEIIVVSDGSSDRTAERAAQFDDIKLIAYEKNRGYGAAIKTGFEASRGDLVSFLDADGTCNPLFFVDLVNLLEENTADIALGSRMGADSEMPKIRRVGNIFFRALIRLISHKPIQDAASGMRVIRRTSLVKLYPLPSGLHFTPAMSCRAALDSSISIVEKPMKYKERVGPSKLGIIQDGFRFLRIIMEISLTYKPFSFFGYLATLCILLAVGYGMYPTVFYLQNRFIEDWMIYRFVFITVMGTVGFNLYIIGMITARLTSFQNPYTNPRRNYLMMAMEKIVFRKPIITACICFFAAVLLNIKTIHEYVTQGAIDVHWVFIITGACLVLLSSQFASYAIFDRTVKLLKEQRDFGDGYNRKNNIQGN
jgi:glycosyltransferase involved in cell wall biosynthesis